MQKLIYAMIFLLILNSNLASAITRVDQEIPGNKTSQFLLPQNEVVQSRLHGERDRDWFRFQMKANTVYEINMTRDDDPRNALDTTIILRDSAGRFLAEDDDGGMNLESRLTYTSSKDQWVFVVARQAKSGSTGISLYGNYRIKIQVTHKVRAFTQFESALTLGVGTPSEKFLRLHEEKHVYKVYLRSSNSYEINVLGSGTGVITNALCDTYLEVYNKGRVKIDEDDDSGLNLDSKLNFNPPSTGIYYLVVTRPNAVNCSGRYRLNVQKR